MKGRRVQAVHGGILVVTLSRVCDWARLDSNLNFASDCAANHSFFLLFGK